MTYQWLAQPVAETPWKTPIVLDLETQVGQRRSNYDDRSLLRSSDSTLRADQHVEVSAPFRIGAFSVRPYVSGRGTFYDNTLADESETRVALEPAAAWKAAEQLPRPGRGLRFGSLGQAARGANGGGPDEFGISHGHGFPPLSGSSGAGEFRGGPSVRSWPARGGRAPRPTPSPGRSWAGREGYNPAVRGPQAPDLRPCSGPTVG